MNWRQRVPWWVKIAAKVVLSRVPVSYSAWERLRLFKHGQMERADYALGVFRHHFGQGAFKPGFTVLELGPGDSLFTAVIARAFGASRCWLVDVGAFARSDIRPYRALIAQLHAQGLPVAALQACATVPELLSACNASYLTEGVPSFGQIPAASVDLVFSHAVLEHVRKKDFPELVEQTRRVLSAGGIASHRVDLKDHLGGALNNLRFSERVWESDFMSRSGFYTNRIRYREMLDLFERGGLRCAVTEVDRFDALPTPRSALDGSFARLPDDDLMVSSFDIVLKQASIGRVARDADGGRAVSA